MRGFPKRASRATLLAVALLATVLAAGCGGGPDPNLDLGGIDMGQAFDGVLQRTQKAIAGITGLEAARKANTELALVNQDLDDLLYHLPGLNAEGRAALAGKATRALADLQPVAERIGEMPALDDVVGETLRGTLSRLEQVR